VNSKYIQTHFGIYPLKFFFSEGMQTDSGEEVSTREIKKILQIALAMKINTGRLPTTNFLPSSMKKATRLPAGQLPNTGAAWPSCSQAAETVIKIAG